MDRLSVNRGGPLRGRCFILPVVALAVCAVARAPSAYAQVNPFVSYKGPTLPRQDLDTAVAAMNMLLDRTPASAGQTETWTGPKSGNRGSFTIRRVFERSGMPCRIVTSEVIYKRHPTQRGFTHTVCRIADGRWKLAD